MKTQKSDFKTIFKIRYKEKKKKQLSRNCVVTEKKHCRVKLED